MKKRRYVRSVVPGLSQNANGHYQYRRRVPDKLRQYFGRLEYLATFEADSEKEAIAVALSHAGLYSDLINEAIAERLKDAISKLTAA